MGVQRKRSSLAAHANCGFSDSAHVLLCVPEALQLAVNPEIMGVTGTNMQWGHFFAKVPVKRGRALHLI